MKKVLFALFAFCLLLVPGAFAGTYTLDNYAVHLQGDTGVGNTFWLESQVKIKFNHLRVSWDKAGSMGRLRYDMTCLDGKAVLQNVKYIDDALNGTEQVRWEQSATGLNRDFSYLLDSTKLKRNNTVKFNHNLNLAPANIKNSKVEFHVHASGRHYIITWEPFTQKVYTSWNRLK